MLSVISYFFFALFFHFCIYCHTICLLHAADKIMKLFKIIKKKIELMYPKILIVLSVELLYRLGL